MIFRIGMRTLFLLIAVLALGCGWYAASLRACAVQQAALNRLKSHGEGSFALASLQGRAYSCGLWTGIIARTNEAPGADALGWLKFERSSDTGELELFRNVIAIEFIGVNHPQTVEDLEQFSHLESITFKRHFAIRSDSREKEETMVEALKKYAESHPDVSVTMPDPNDGFYARPEPARAFSDEQFSWGGPDDDPFAP